VSVKYNLKTFTCEVEIALAELPHHKKNTTDVTTLSEFQSAADFIQKE
jgi:hypothetical protein